MIIIGLLTMMSLSFAHINFEFTAIDSMVETDTTGQWGVIILRGDVLNLTSSSIRITAIRETQQIPATWSCNFCFGSACLAPFIDEYSDDVAGDSLVDFTLDIYPNGEIGTGIWLMTMIDSVSMETDSALFTLTYNPTTSIDGSKRPIQMSFSAYPNPTNDFISLQIPTEYADGISTMKIYDITGRNVLEKQHSIKTGQNAYIDVSSLSSGMYFVSVQQGNLITQTKIQVVK